MRPLTRFGAFILLVVLFVILYFDYEQTRECKAAGGDRVRTTAGLECIYLERMR